MFAADAKSAGHSKTEVAALMGHGSEETSGASYAQKRFGKGSLSVTPSARDVAAVRAKAQAKVLRAAPTPAPGIPARRHALPRY